MSFSVVSRESSITFKMHIYFSNDSILMYVLVFTVSLLTCRCTGSDHINYYVMII